MTEATDGPGVTRRTTTSPALWWATALLGLAGAALVAYTTSWLWFGYRPGETFYCSVGPLTACVPPGQMQEAGRWHVVGLIVLSVTGVGAVLLSWLGPRRRWLTGAVGLIATLASIGAAVITPQFLWERLGLWAVGTGQQFSGLQNMKQEEVRFAVVGGTERDPAALIRWFTANVVLTIGSIVLLTIVLLVIRPRRTRTSVTRLEMSTD